MSKIVWSPQPRQSAFMCRPEYECLYGGAAGGGKSDAMLCEAMRQIKVPNYKGIIFRKTYPQLQELILRSNELYKAVVPQAKYNVNTLSEQSRHLCIARAMWRILILHRKTIFMMSAGMCLWIIQYPQGKMCWSVTI